MEGLTMEVRRITEDELYHHGVKGQRWGFRRYQNADGSLTSAGIKKYNRKVGKLQSLEKRREKLEFKAAKLKKKASDAHYKALRARTDKTYRKRELKSAKLERKSARLEYSAAKKIKRGNKIYKKIPDTFKQAKVKDVDQAKLEYAKKYAAKYLK